MSKNKGAAGNGRSECTTDPIVVRRPRVIIVDSDWIGGQELDEPKAKRNRLASRREPGELARIVAAAVLSGTNRSGGEELR